VKAEYLYVNFNNQTIGPGTFTLIENVVRGGVNYRFERIIRRTCAPRLRAQLTGTPLNSSEAANH